MDDDQRAAFSHVFAAQRREGGRIEHPEQFAGRPNATKWTFDRKHYDFRDDDGRKYRVLREESRPVGTTGRMRVPCDYIEGRAETMQLPSMARPNYDISLTSRKGVTADGSALQVTAKVEGYERIGPRDRSGRVYLILPAGALV